MFVLCCALILGISARAFAQDVTGPSDDSEKTSEQTLVEKFDIVDDQGNPVVKIRSQYGQVDLNEVTDQKIEEFNSLSAAANDENAATVFAAEGEDLQLPARFQKLKYRIFRVPKQVTDYAQAVYHAPTPREWAAGILFMTIDVAITGTVWFSTPGIPKSIAAAYVAGVGVSSLIHNVFHGTLSNIYAHGLVHRAGRSSINLERFKMIFRNVVYEGATGLILNTLAGWRNPPGQVGGNAIIGLFLNMPLQSQTNVMFRSNRTLNMSYKLMMLPMVATLAAFEATGKVPPLWPMGIFAVKWTTLGLIGTYGGFLLMNAAMPDRMMKAVVWVDRYLERLENVAIGAFQKIRTEASKVSCAIWLKPKKPLED